MGEYCISCMRQLADGEMCSCGFDKSKYVVEDYHLTPGTLLSNKYYVGKVIGEGGFGITYVGKDILLDRKVAIKEFFLSGYATRNSSKSTEVISKGGSKRDTYMSFLDKFLHEGQVLARFGETDGIVHIIDYFRENNTAYIVMEFIEGETLKQYCESKGKLSLDEIMEIMTPIMNSLKVVHSQNIIHRDISPDNIMVTKYGQRKLLDFGAARAFDANEEKTLSVILKPGYAPEEQYRAKANHGPWSDIYSLCATIYYCMTGITPNNSIERVVVDDVVHLAELRPDCDRSICDAIMKGMSVFAKDRFYSIEELRDALNPRYDGTGMAHGASEVGTDYGSNVLYNGYQDNMAQDYNYNQTENQYGQQINNQTNSSGMFAAIILLVALISIVGVGAVIVFSGAIELPGFSSSYDDDDDDDDVIEKSNTKQVKSDKDKVNEENVLEDVADSGDEAEAVSEYTNGEYEKEPISNSWVKYTCEEMPVSLRVPNAYQDEVELVDEGWRVCFYAKQCKANGGLLFTIEDMDYYSYSRLKSNGDVAVIYDDYIYNSDYIIMYGPESKQYSNKNMEIYDYLYSYFYDIYTTTEYFGQEQSSEYILPESNIRLLTESDLYGLSSEELRLARNEIYARYGRRFKDSSVQAYFDSKSWYQGIYSPDEFDRYITLSDIELKNCDFIKKYE